MTDTLHLDFENLAREIDPQIGHFGPTIQYAPRRLRESLARFQARLANAALSDEEKTLLDQAQQHLNGNVYADMNQTLDTLRGVAALAALKGEAA